MNFFVLAPLTAAIINAFLGFFVFTRSPRSHANRVYLLFSLALVLWNLGVLFMFFAETPTTALSISRALHLPVIFLLFFLIHMVMLIFKIEIKKPYYIFYSIPAILGSTTFSPFIIKDVQYSGYSFYGVAGPGFYIFTFFLVIAFLAFIPIAIKKRKAATGFETQKINSLIIAYFILLFSGLHDTLPVFEIYNYPILGMTVYPLGTIGSSIFAVFLAYGVLQHQILDIYTSLGRISATCARLFLLFLVFFLSLLTVALIFPSGFSYFSLFSSILIFLATTSLGSIFFPKLIGIGEEHLEKRILGDRFEYQDKIREFSNSILYYSSEKYLYDDLDKILIRVFGFHSYSFFLIDENSESFYLQQSHPKRAAEDSNLLPINSVIPKWFKDPTNQLFGSLGNSNVLNLEDLDEAQKPSLRDLQVKLCFRLKSGNELLGFLMVGEKTGNRPVTNLDLTLLLELTTNLGLFINQSRLKRQIARAQEVELLGNLSRGLAHDLNNLITPIFTYCQLAESSPERSESLKDFAHLAKRNLMTMQAYIKESLFFSTNQEPKFHHVRVMEILKDAGALHERTLAERNIRLQVSCPENLEMTFDDVLIQRLLSNLIHNAADASPRDAQIELTVAVLNRSFQKRKWIRFTVQDYGTGIPEEEIDRVFIPYYTTKDTGDNRRGSGLGLSICRRIVDLHHGSISIYSKVDAGTRVEVDLPSNLPPAPSNSYPETVHA